MQFQKKTMLLTAATGRERNEKVDELFDVNFDVCKTKLRSNLKLRVLASQRVNFCAQ